MGYIGVEPAEALITPDQVDPSLRASLLNTVNSGLTKLIHPDVSKGFGDLYKQGVYPAMFNQQWGGANYGGLPDGTLGEVATGYIIDNAPENMGDVATRVYTSMGFKVGKTTDITRIWIKLYKNGNPTDSLQLAIYDDLAGAPNAVIVNGTATAINGIEITNNIDGEWLKFEFAIAPNVIGGTQYHYVLSRSGAVDATNFYIQRADQQSLNLYPHGHKFTADATPTWTGNTVVGFCFLVQPAMSILQSDALLGDGKLSCFEGSDLDQSGAFAMANDNFLNHKRGSFIITGSGFTKDKTILDVGTGSDNNRIVLRSNITTGFTQIDLYENNENKLTITGTTDISTGNHIVGFVYRAEGDGADYLKLFVDGISEGTELLNQTITLDESFVVDGHTTIGGGFGLAPTWTQNLDMSVLPSAVGWTWNSTAIEANAMVVNNGVLYQNGAGYASTDTGYYAKTTTLNNATGWCVETKIKLKDVPSSPAVSPIFIGVYDGAKAIRLLLHEQYIELYGASHIAFLQLDLTDINIVEMSGQGNDFYIYINGQLIFDGTGLLTATTSSNQIRLGDTDGTAGYNATAEWHYVKYYEGLHMPEFTNGSISEMAYWNGDKSSAMPYFFNGGTPQSIKRLAGVKNNYIEKVRFRKEVKGIVSDPTTTSTSLIDIPDMNMFVLGSKFNIAAMLNISNTVAGGSVNFCMSADGKNGAVLVQHSAIASQLLGFALNTSDNTADAMHVFASKVAVGSGAGAMLGTTRNIKIEGN